MAGFWVSRVYGRKDVRFKGFRERFDNPDPQAGKSSRGDVAGFGGLMVCSTSPPHHESDSSTHPLVSVSNFP